MVVYHGSDRSFKRLRIAERLVSKISTKDNEGLGIYFSTDKEVARSYGKYIYTLEVNDKLFIDFRKRCNCSNYVNKIIRGIYKIHGVNLSLYFDVPYFIDRMYLGGQRICTVGKDIAEVLDNSDDFYSSFSKTKREMIYRSLKGYDNQLKAYMFNYHINNIGVLKSVEDDVVNIIKKESSY